MKQNLTELVFILDRSGSMQGLEGDTIRGFNAMIEKQKKEPGEAFVSTVLFDDRTEVLHDRVKVGEVRPITEKEYYVRGCTALLDAIGGAMLAHKAEAEGRFVADLLLGRAPLRGVAPIPACVYTSPELAQVGLTADEARARGIP